MTDDDHDLRDDFGDEITDALSSRAGSAPVIDVAAVVEQRAGRRRTRRRALTGIAAVVVAVAVTVAGLIATGDHPSKRVRVATPVPPSSTTIAVTPGDRVVSYHGVHVEVPDSWPVEDGMHTGLCGGPFGDTKTAFVGPQSNFPPSCPATIPDPSRDARDGVWLYAEVPPADAHAVTTAAGQTILEYPPTPRFVRQFWFHDVSVEIGLGPDQRVADAILASLGFTPGAPDTPAALVCTRSEHPETMPAPERLATQMVLENGDVTLDPLSPTDVAVMTAEQEWNQQSYRANFEHYRLILARYSSRFPATIGPNGKMIPEDQNVLAWIVYSEPLSPTIPGCGMWGVDVTNAITGKGIGSSGYSPGP